MIQRIQIDGLGPHASTTLDIGPGVTEIRGPSESGKSTILDAICFAVAGTDRDGKPLAIEAIRDEAKAADVTVTTDTTAIRRAMTRARTIRRMVGGEVLPSDEAVSAKIGDLSRRVAGVHAARLVMVPFGWVALLDGAGGGRPLRDFLAALVPGDERAEVARLMMDAGIPLRVESPISAKQAEAQRAEANRALAAAEGAMSAASALTPGEAPAGPDAATLAHSRDVIDRATAWTTYDSAHRIYSDRHDAHLRSVAAHADWTRRCSELGVRPAAPDLSAARQAVAAAVGKGTSATREASRLAGMLSAAESRLASLTDAGDTCPTCGRDGWDAAARLVEAARVAVETAREDAVSAERAASDVAREIDAARAALEALTAEGAAAEAWDRANRAMGAEPAVQPAPAQPTAPTWARPEASVVGAARAAIDAARAAEGAAAQRERQRIAAEAEVARRSAALAEARSEAAYAAALVDAVRRSPGARTRRLSDALGDLGPVGLAFPESGPAVEVTIDGRPWWLASRGRRVYADAHLRAGLRRALAMPEIPIFVDERGAWSGEDPAIPGPVVYLITDAGPLRATSRPGV